MSTPKRIRFFPRIALVYFIGSVALVVAAVFMLEKVVLPIGQDATGKMPSLRWVTENSKLFSFMESRNLASPACPVWRSSGYPVSEAKTKSKRILVMGDSFVWGHGYANMNTIWWRQLQKELVRRGYNDVEVIAAGMSGASTEDELRWVKELTPKYKPDLIVWGYVTNDPGTPRYSKDSVTNEVHQGFEDLAKEDHVMRYRAPEDPWLLKQGRQLLAKCCPDLENQLFGLRFRNQTRVFSGKKNGYGYFDWEQKLLEGENFEVYKRTLADLGRFAVQSHVPQFVLTLPNGFLESDHAIGAAHEDFYGKIRAYFTSRYAPVQAVFEQNGLQFINTLDDFLATIEKDDKLAANQNPLKLGINPVNGHPGPLATHFFACEAADILEKQYPQVLGSKSETPSSAVAPHFNDWIPPYLFPVQKGNEVVFYYPEASKDAAFMPIKKPHAQLSLADAVAIKGLKLSGKDLKNADIYFSWEDPAGAYDDGTLEHIGTKDGADVTWDLSNSAHAKTMNTILISARFKGPDRRLVLTVEPETRGQ